MLQLDDRLDRFLAQHVHRVLVGQIVRPLHSVVGVPLPAVFFQIAQRRADAALGRAGVGAGGVQFGNDGHVGAAAGVERGHQPRPARADDDRVKDVRFHLEPRGIE